MFVNKNQPHQSIRSEHCVLRTQCMIILTRSREPVEVPKSPGYLMCPPATVIRVQLGSSFCGRYSQTTIVWQTSFNYFWDIMIVHDTERVRSSHSFFLWPLVSFANSLAESDKLVSVGRIPYGCVSWILSELAVLQEFTCFFIEDSQSKILKNSGRVTASSCHCRRDNTGLALEP